MSSRSNIITNLNDFFVPGSDRLIDKEDWLELFRIHVSDQDLTEVSYIIRSAFNKLGLRDNSVCAPLLPHRPLLIEIANMTTKGSTYFHKLLRIIKDSKKNMNGRENRWHNELGCVLSTECWIGSYQLTAGIKYENKLKWLQFEINRN